MGSGVNTYGRARRAGVSRRAVLRSGAAVTAGGCLALSGAGTAAAQSEDHWPIQGFDPENTRHATGTAPLTTAPSELATADVGAGPHADFLLSNGVAYIHTRENSLGAVKLGTGELLWRQDNGDVPLTPEGIDGDELLARALDGTVYAFSLDTGEIAAEIPLENGNGLGYNGTGQWYAPVSAGTVVAGETGSRERRWEADVSGVGVRPAVTDDHVVVSTVEVEPGNLDIWEPSSMDAEGRIYALDAADGSVSWDAGRVGAGVGEPVVRNGRVYWAGVDGDILVHDIETGERVWEFKTDGSFPRAPVVTDDVVVAGNEDGSLYGVDADSGDEIGQFDAGGAISANPVAVDGVAYIGTQDGTVYAFDYENGEELWAFETGSSVRSLAPGDDRLVVGTYDGYHVLGGGSADGGDADAGLPSDDTGDDPNAGGDGDSLSGDGGSSSGDGDSRSGPASRQRGLFSNGGDPDAVSNAFNMTVLGFLLSILGIIYQMIGGR